MDILRSIVKQINPLTLNSISRMLQCFYVHKNLPRYAKTWKKISFKIILSRMLKGSIINYTYIEILERNIYNYIQFHVFFLPFFSVLLLSYKDCTMSGSLNGEVDRTLRAVFKERNFEKKKFVTLHNIFFILVNSRS